MILSQKKIEEIAVAVTKDFNEFFMVARNNRDVFWFLAIFYQLGNLFDNSRSLFANRREFLDFDF